MHKDHTRLINLILHELNYTFYKSRKHSKIHTVSLYSICPTALLISISTGSVITSFFLTVRDPQILKTADLRSINDSLVLSQFVTTLSS